MIDTQKLELLYLRNQLYPYDAVFLIEAIDKDQAPAMQNHTHSKASFYSNLPAQETNTKT